MKQRSTTRYELGTLQFCSIHCNHSATRVLQLLRSQFSYEPLFRALTVLNICPMLFASIHVTVMAMVLQSGNVTVCSSASLRVLATGNVREPVQAHKDTSFCLMNVAEQMRQSVQETVSLQQHGAKKQVIRKSPYGRPPLPHHHHHHPALLGTACTASSTPKLTQSEKHGGDKRLATYRVASVFGTASALTQIASSNKLCVT